MAEKSETSKKPTAIEAWIAYKLELDPAKLTFVSKSSERGMIRYEHPVHRDIVVDKMNLNYIHSPRAGVMNDSGLESKEFLAFLAGYSGNGSKPGLFHPILQAMYNRGVEARARTVWPEKRSDSSCDSDKSDDNRTFSGTGYSG